MAYNDSKARMIHIAFLGIALLLVGFLHAEDSNCMTAKCHQKFKTMKQLHAPVDEDCTNCHEKTGKHAFKFADRANLCIGCHDDKKEGKQVHEALSSGACTDCHDPHGGKFKALLKTKRIDTTCFDCHDKEPMQKKFLHGPNASGNCTLCHDAHSSNHQNLLVTSKTVICIRCHSDKDFTGKGKHQHSPMKQGCSGCHSPHSADFKFQLHKSPENLCGQCHQKMEKQANDALFKHAALQQGDRCYNCHDPHGSVFENNLKLSPLNQCLDCHNKKILGSDGKDYNIYKIVTKNPQKHGPIEDGECTGCHDPHGSQYYKILKSSFPKEFYTPYDVEKYGICFECHENEIAQTEFTSTLTDFRDGKRNLHYVHVNMQKGRTCRACHEIHAGTQAKHVREETPFGTWSMPVGFEINKNGGSCAPGCHKSFTYDRTKKSKES
jgi:predicted CXXCH cytochrome family protein